MFPLVGVIVIIIGIVMAFADQDDQALARTLVIAGGILAYVSIFYNKR